MNKRLSIFLLIISACLIAFIANLNIRFFFKESEDTQKILWVTDTHFTLRDRSINHFVELASSSKYSNVFITGDIANDGILGILHLIEKKISKPIYFVLGNSDHNYYQEILNVQKSIKQNFEKSKFLHYLDNKIIFLDEKYALIGFDGFANTWVANEYSQFHKLIESLKVNIEHSIKMDSKKIIILTHVPPFKESCWYRGKVSSGKQAEQYYCSALGNLLLDLSKKNKKIKFIVFSGHTHHVSAEKFPIGDKHQNIDVYVGNKFVEGENKFNYYEINNKNFQPNIKHKFSE